MATKVFLKRGAIEAIQTLDKPHLDALQKANIGKLAQTLAKDVYDLPWPEWQNIRQDPSSGTAQALDQASLVLNQFLGESSNEN